MIELDLGWWWCSRMTVDTVGGTAEVEVATRDERDAVVPMSAAALFKMQSAGLQPGTPLRLFRTGPGKLRFVWSQP